MNNDRIIIAGSGLAGLSTAFYAINDAGIAGNQISIIDENPFIGGSLDAFSNDFTEGYFMRGFRMLEPYVYSALFDLMSHIPCLENRNKTILQDFIEFNRDVKTCSKSRLIKNGKAVNARPFTLNLKDRIKILKLLLLSEKQLENLTIEDYFSSVFFKSNFWYQFCTTFSFQPWHSAEEFKRYILRFFQAAPTLDTHTCIRSTRYNQHESIVMPLKQWLKDRGVNFLANSGIKEVELSKSENGIMINKLLIETSMGDQTQKIRKNDKVFITLGSMTSGYSVGSMLTAPVMQPDFKNNSWKLWEKMAQFDPEFGNPPVFIPDVNKTGWVSFTITFNKPDFFELLEKITQTPAGTEGPITLHDSDWLISFALPKQPHFKNQPDHLQVLWGYGLFPAKTGNFVNKKMLECTGKEILTEIIHHLKFEDRLDKIVDSANCIPCYMPYITSQFMPRKPGDRPGVKPASSKNFAFIGQFVEIPEDIVFTLEYSVRSAQIATCSLLNTNRQPTPIYHGWKRLKHVFNVVRTAFR